MYAYIRNFQRLSSVGWNLYASLLERAVSLRPSEYAYRSVCPSPPPPVLSFHSLFHFLAISNEIAGGRKATLILI